MNIILVTPDEIQDDHVELTGNRADHIVKVLRSGEGDSLKLGVVNGPLGSGRIVSLKRKHPRRVVIKPRFDQAMRPAPKLDLVVAMARPIMMRRIFSQATAMGVGKFFIVHANRVEKSFWEATILEDESYLDFIYQGLEQAIDTRVPAVEFHRRFKPFIEDVLPGIKDDYSHMVLADPSAAIGLEGALEGEVGRVLLAIGPEGGWVDYELEKFANAGFTTCSLGQRILKVDTAVVALHARINQICVGRSMPGWGV